MYNTQNFRTGFQSHNLIFSSLEIILTYLFFCAQADLLHAGLMVRDLPPDSLWSLGGVGDFQLMMNSIAIAAGGGVRVGIEDNVWYDLRRTRLARNTDLIHRIHNLAEVNERKIMRPEELRKSLKLQDGNERYGRVHNSNCPS